MVEDRGKEYESFKNLLSYQLFCSEKVVKLNVSMTRWRETKELEILLKPITDFNTANLEKRTGVVFELLLSLKAGKLAF